MNSLSSSNNNEEEEGREGRERKKKIATQPICFESVESHLLEENGSCFLSVLLPRSNYK